MRVDSSRVTGASAGGGEPPPALKTRPASALVELLDLEQIDANLFRGVSDDETTFRVFGGQVAAQALVAAGRTVPSDRLVHSLHAYFILAGDPKIPIVYQVDRTRDGRFFTTRRVIALQKGEAIFSLSASFHTSEHGPEHQVPVLSPAAAGPPPSGPYEHDEVTEPEERKAVRSFPVDVKWVDGASDGRGQGRPMQRSWIRADGTLPDDPLIHSCALAYASDLGLLAAALPPHGLAPHRGEVMMASLDHAMWFHRPFRADEWLFYANECPVAVGARALVRGEVFDTAGRLVASVAQEGLLRVARRLT